MGRRWLLRLIMPVMLLFAFSGCTTENIAPATESQTAPPYNVRLSEQGDIIMDASASYDPAIYTAEIELVDAECIRTIYPGIVFRFTNSPADNGIYLLPYETMVDKNLELGQILKVSYQIIPGNNRFNTDGEVVCLGVPGDFDGGYTTRILSLTE